MAVPELCGCVLEMVGVSWSIPRIQAMESSECTSVAAWCGSELVTHRVFEPSRGDPLIFEAEVRRAS